MDISNHMVPQTRPGNFVHEVRGTPAGGRGSTWALWCCSLQRLPHPKPIVLFVSSESDMLQIGNLNESLPYRANRFDLVSSRVVGAGIDKDRWDAYIDEIVR